MAKAKECVVVCNTKWGYCLTPQIFPSIAAGLRFAKEMEMAYRLYVGGKLVRSGWY